MIRSAFAYIEKDGKVLLLKEGGELAYGLWSLPGGHVEENETFEQGAVREAFEESGYTISLNGIIHKTILKAEEYKGSLEDSGNIELVIFRGDIVGGELKKDDQALDLKWIDKQNIKDLLFRWDFIEKIIADNQTIH